MIICLVLKEKEEKEKKEKTENEKKGKAKKKEHFARYSSSTFVRSQETRKKWYIGSRHFRDNLDAISAPISCPPSPLVQGHLALI